MTEGGNFRFHSPDIRELQLQVSPLVFCNRNEIQKIFLPKKLKVNHDPVERFYNTSKQIRSKNLSIVHPVQYNYKQQLSKILCNFVSQFCLFHVRVSLKNTFVCPKRIYFVINIVGHRWPVEATSGHWLPEIRALRVSWTFDQNSLYCLN